MSKLEIVADRRGATAIEYAIIAGLIGLGLVGSLVTTRGSLSAVFGTASNQMGSAAVQTDAGPTQPGVLMFEGRSLLRRETGVTDTGRPSITWYFDDGSKVLRYPAVYDSGGRMTGNEGIQIYLMGSPGVFRTAAIQSNSNTYQIGTISSDGSVAIDYMATVTGSSATLVNSAGDRSTTSASAVPGYQQTMTDLAFFRAN